MWLIKIKNCVRFRCNGLENCLVNSTNRNFQDNCEETLKYIEVDYYCEGKWQIKTNKISSFQITTSNLLKTKLL